MYNKVVLVGYLTRDIEIRYSQSGSAIASVGIATNRKWKSQTGEMRDETMFIDLTFFGRTAEIAHQYLRKGSKVLVDGRLVFQQWIGKDGTKRSKHLVTVESLKMLDTKAESQNLNHNNGYGNQVTQNSYNKQQQPANPNSYETEMNNNTLYSNSYNAPQQQPKSSQQQQPSSYIPQQTRQAPVPEIDIDEDEIPF